MFPENNIAVTTEHIQKKKKNPHHQHFQEFSSNQDSNAAVHTYCAPMYTHYIINTLKMMLVFHMLKTEHKNMVKLIIKLLTKFQSIIVYFYVGADLTGMSTCLSPISILLQRHLNFKPQSSQNAVGLGVQA